MWQHGGGAADNVAWRAVHCAAGVGRRGRCLLHRPLAPGTHLRDQPGLDVDEPPDLIFRLCQPLEGRMATVRVEHPVLRQLVSQLGLQVYQIPKFALSRKYVVCPLMTALYHIAGSNHFFRGADYRLDKLADTFRNLH